MSQQEVTSPSSRRAWIEIEIQPVHRSGLYVALLAEGVDRNKIALTDERNIMRSPSSRRAWIEIAYGVCILCIVHTSPSSRRAWIEITNWLKFIVDAAKSPSSRRAWIEIYEHRGELGRQRVALLAEGVDRNHIS